MLGAVDGACVARSPGALVVRGPARAGGLGAAMIGVLWSYGGWQHTGFAAAEAKDAQRDVPRAMIAATAIVLCTYVLANLAYLRLLPIAAIAGSTHVGERRGRGRDRARGRGQSSRRSSPRARSGPRASTR